MALAVVFLNQNEQAFLFSSTLDWFQIYSIFKRSKKISMPLANTIYYVVIYGSIFLMLKQWYLNILGVIPSLIDVPNK